MEADVVPGAVTVSMVVESISAVVVVSSSGRSIEQSDSSSHQRGGHNLQFVSLGVTVSVFCAQDALIVQAEFVDLATECFHLQCEFFWRGWW